MKKEEKLLIFDAEPFGFGPISSTLNLIKTLRDNPSFTKDFYYVLLGKGTSYQLALQSKLFDQVIECDTHDFSSLDQHKALFLESTAFISNTNPVSIEFTYKYDFPSFYIDTLFWMWDRLQTNFSKVLRYYIEDFHCTDLDLKRFQISNTYIVPPLISFNHNQRAVEDDLIVFSFGGIDSDFTLPPLIYIEIVKWAVHFPYFKNKRVYICGGGNSIKQLKNLYGKFNSNVFIGCLDPASFTDLLQRAKKAVCNPGLHTFYETCSLRKDVLFLPPQNYSQYLQLQFINQKFKKIQSIQFTDYNRDFKIEARLPEVQGINKVQEINEKITQSSTYISQTLQKLESFFLDADCYSQWPEESFPYKESGSLLIARDMSEILNELYV